MPALPPYAVVFKTHFWDDFTSRQFTRLRNHAGTDALFVLVDETAGAIPDIGHDRIIRMTESIAADAGLPLHPVGNVFWYNTDYQLYHFVSLFPYFAYIVTVEYDCVVNVPIAHIIRTMADNGADFAGSRVRGDPSSWYWGNLVRPYYPAGLAITGRLLCFAVFSHGFASQLRMARQAQAARFFNQTSGGPSLPWPNNEGFVGAELAQWPRREIRLAEFGDMSSYDWAPPHVEAQLPLLAQRAFIHPVLDEPRFLPAVIKSGWNLDEMFNPATILAKAAAACTPAPLVAGLLRHFASTNNFAAIERLHQYATSRGVAMPLLHDPPG